MPYCVKCKKAQDWKDEPQSVTLKNGKQAWRGTCPACGTTMFKIGANK